MSSLAREAASGFLFSAALLSAGVYAPEVIQAQMTFKSNTMVSVMMGASAASAVIFDLAHRFDFSRKTHRPPSEYGYFPYDGNVLGGALIGIGMATTGSCPGTVLVQVGVGMPRGIFVAGGGILGGWAFVRMKAVLDKKRPRFPRSGTGAQASKSKQKRPLDLATKLGVSPLSLLIVWVSACLAGLRVLSVMETANSALVSPVYGGLLVGASQLATLLLTGHALGTSSAFEDVGRWLDAKLIRRIATEKGPKLMTSSVSFALGMVAASAVLDQMLLDGKGGGGLQRAAEKGFDMSAAVQYIAGGFAMLFGARLGGGCTSGHGISGLARFSLSSLVSTAAMFSAGILTAQAMAVLRS